MIEFNNVSLRYNLEEEILADLNFKIKPGSFQFLIGPSGAGKTSLLRLIFLSLPLTRGTITVFGKDSTSLNPKELSYFRRRMGVVFQDFYLLPHLTLYENAGLPLRVRGYKEMSYRDNLIDLLKWIGLSERIDSYPKILSGDEHQRAIIARALIHQPEILLLDELKRSLDPSFNRRLLHLFTELNRRGTSIVIATHDWDLMDQYREYKARCLILNQKRLCVYELIQHLSKIK
ncbi:cell division ATP-binding protein FtsE [Candidatus Endowatersipora endosymbiont of Watersipora subatra]|uniref:cell division ATP-binding protein FtsE n=1 Tax=Candidatus Endowatersipora endosymbiont of Watersipora subatra TaxID=3077946 RepID=UPI00312C7A28